jgi:molybdopterin synthase catalytic subunit
MSAATTAADRVRLLDIRPVPLSADEVLAAVADPAAGGITLFVGTVRDHDHDRPVTALAYEAHPDALARLREVAERVAADPLVIALAAVHRTGQLVVGDTAVIVAVAAAHRDAAFAASRRLIDELKADVPIWKHQRFSDGTTEWVGVC